MLPSPNRLPPFRIPVVMRFGKRAAAGELILVVQKGEADVSRFACIVPAKTDKRATARNRMKRLITESIRHLLPRFRDPIDCVVIARRWKGQLTQAEMNKRTKDLLQRAGLISV
jgi:ribonuclease P protein component